MPDDPYCARPPRPFGQRATAEHGSAVAEFVMVSTLLLVVGLSIIQLALIVHVRNTLIDAATHGARYGALANRSVQDGAERTRTLISQSLGGGFAGDITTATDGIGERELVEITVHTRMPLLGLLPNGWDVHITGQAVRYD